MRIGTHSRYTMMQYHQNTSMQGLSNVLAQMNGLKIQYGYQDSSIFNKTLSLDFNINTLKQSKDLANNALTFTKHTDTALNELTKSMDNFKTKLIQGANDIHNETSRLAIAKDLRAIRDHFLSIANTSIGGEYIFGGTATTKSPFNANGSYNGNGDALNALLGSNNSLSYNITGSELFFGSDRDTNRVISTNVPKYNQSKLNPRIMDPLHPTGVSEKVFIKAEDTLRDLVGDNDDKTDNNAPEVFYITGRKPDGTAFKSKFEMQVSYTDKNQAPKVQDLLDKIGREFGNTETSKVVDVTLNEWGQIEIKDLTGGRSNIEFSMVSSSYKAPNNQQANPNANPPTDGIGVLDIDALLSSGVKVNSYVQSPFLGGFSSSNIASVEDYNDHRIHTIPTTFRTHTNEVAKTTTLLRDIFPADVTAITLSGTTANTAPDVAGAAVAAPVNFAITATATVQDLMDQIKNVYSAGGGDVDVQFSEGKIIAVDNNVSKKNPPDKDDEYLPYIGESSLAITLTAIAGAQTTNGFRNDYNVEYDRVDFSRNGSVLTSNVSQVVRSSNEYAKLETKLSEVAGTSLDGHNYNFKVKDVNGTDIRGRIEFATGGSFMVIESPAQMNGVNIANVRVPILQANGNPPQVSGDPTAADNVTYQQLADTLGMVLNLSNSNPQDLQNVFQANANFNTPANKASYEAMLGNAKYNVNITLDVNGVLQIKDLHRTPTRMEFSLYDNTSDNYTLNAQGRIDGSRPALTFQANSAIVADDPHVNFFQQIDKMIEALEVGSYRPGGTSAYDDAMRNPGVQNALLAFDHLADHINKVHTKNGSQGNAFKYSIERTEMLIVQVKTLRSDTIDTDFAEAYLQFSTLSMGYQAMLSSIGKISQLSLVNYL
ncbi:flagellar hook-associated protein FlgL [Helicobacter turcicus]|uniref:Flagellar hook-associated protein FlgL n=1 Tax=Helicobacter turcicus TaxID=2867412 RepID=A0ABS7JN38_9HELI|nr:flagellar hook-associated protein FlgL [Helicobacter turcicus]MBX7490806.1 flagellar hook-associated protein FlgL [Helicobacter turcicus]MBX7545585.1 flagellar hook-associated protein FlgL [Helicobacter turcicus]